MKKRNRAWRRGQAERIQVKRQKNWAVLGKSGWGNEPKNFGKFRKSNFSCGCCLCKPWKHGHHDKYRESKS